MEATPIERCGTTEAMEMKEGLVLRLRLGCRAFSGTGRSIYVWSFVFVGSSHGFLGWSAGPNRCTVMHER